MAAGAEACVEDELDDAVAMLADAAASAVLTDQVRRRPALRPERAAELAGHEHGVIGAMARSPRRGGDARLGRGHPRPGNGHENVVGVMNGASPVRRLSPTGLRARELAHVQMARAGAGRSLVRLDAGFLGRAHAEPALSAAVVAMVRSKERLDAGDVSEAITAAETAVSQFERCTTGRSSPGPSVGAPGRRHPPGRVAPGVRDGHEVLRRSRRRSTHSARLQVLIALAHCEFQSGHMDRATAWLRAVEDESVDARRLPGVCGLALASDLPALCPLADYEPQRMHAAVAARRVTRDGWAWPRTRGLERGDCASPIRRRR